jgi:hypothetical protein
VRELRTASPCDGLGARALLVGGEGDAETLGRITSAGREVDVVDELA